MTEAIEDVSSLPGQDISDQEQVKIGKVKEIYATEDGYPMWVAVEVSASTEDDLSKNRIVFIPLARIKNENDQLQVPYSKKRIADAPEVEDGDEISAECDRELRDYYGIDAGDQEMRKDNNSYASRVPEEVGAASRVEDADELETPDADTRTEESKERLHDPGSSKMREVTAEDVVHNTQGDDDGGEDGGAERSDDDGGEERSEDDGGAEDDEEQDG
jgi:hypothetical protein